MSLSKDATPTLIRASCEQLGHIRQLFNNRMNYEPLFLIGATALLTHIIHHYINWIPNDGVTAGLKRSFFRLMRKIPAVKREIKAKFSETEEKIEEGIANLFTSDGNPPTFVTQLPEQGMSKEEILKQIQQYTDLSHFKWGDGKVSGSVYHGGKELTELNAAVYSITAWANPLHPDVFPGVCKMEAEIVRIVGNMFNGGPACCGTVTSGGTESIMLAVKAYRDWGRDKGILYPEIVVPLTAHAAFDKAAAYLNIKIISVPVNVETGQVEIEAMRKLISRRTVMLVASAPSFPWGIIDDVEAVSKLGAAKGVPVHVDCCLGGFLLPFMPAAGFPLPPFDFSLKGVTSISADTHKYGFAPKGSSVLLFRERKFKRFQYYLQPNWPGGIYGTPSIAGSRPGAIIAGCWASLMHFGLEGYVNSTKRIIRTARFIDQNLRQISGIYVIGRPQVSVVAIASKEFDVFRLAEALNSRGWNLNNLQFPSSIHLCVTYCHTEEGVGAKFVSDVKEIVADIRKNPQSYPEGAAAVYGLAQKIPDRSLVEDIAFIYLDSLYNTETKTKHAGNGDVKK